MNSEKNKRELKSRDRCMKEVHQSTNLTRGKTMHLSFLWGLKLARDNVFFLIGGSMFLFFGRRRRRRMCREGKRLRKKEQTLSWALVRHTQKIVKPLIFYYCCSNCVYYSGLPRKKRSGSELNPGRFKTDPTRLMWPRKEKTF